MGGRTKINDGCIEDGSSRPGGAATVCAKPAGPSRKLCRDRQAYHYLLREMYRQARGIDVELREAVRPELRCSVPRRPARSGAEVHIALSPSVFGVLRPVWCVVHRLV